MNTPGQGLSNSPPNSCELKVGDRVRARDSLLSLSHDLTVVSIQRTTAGCLATVNGTLGAGRVSVERPCSAFEKRT